MKLASVIIPVYNMRDTIAKSVLSAAAQTWPAVEVIVVDDGSTDGTAELLDDLAAENSRIRVIHQKNQGVACARITGLNASQGDYISWIDGDDWMEASMLETLINAMMKHHTQAAVSNYETLYQSNGKRKKRYHLNGEMVIDSDTALEMLVRREITQSLWGNVMERSLYQYIQFRPGTLFEDVDNTYKLYRQANRIVLVDQLLFCRYLRKDSISNLRRVERRLESCEVYLNRQKTLHRDYPELDRVFYSSNYPMLLLLRNCVFQDTYANFRENRGRVRAVTREFRRHMSDAFSEENPGFLEKLEYLLITSGSYSGFYLSRLLAIGKKGGTRLKQFN